MYPDKITHNSKGIGYCAKAKLPKEGPDRGAIFFLLPEYRSMRGGVLMCFSVCWPWLGPVF